MPERKGSLSGGAAESKDSSGSKGSSNGKGNTRVRNVREGSPRQAELRIKKECGE